MANDAASLVTDAKKWATNYGDYSNGQEGAVLTAPLRARAAWEANDADAFADMFIENGSMLVGDEQLTSREQIRSYVGQMLSGGYRDTRWTETPREIRLLTDSTALCISDGGFVRAGTTTLDPLDVVRATWVVVKRDGDWRIASYQSSPMRN
jgi:uncharacterized protein (TIGR02246 family)